MEKIILERVLSTQKRKTEAEECEFLELIDRIDGYCDLESARVLMKTFSAAPDYGTQESVISAILSAGREIYIQVILEELERLYAEGPDWIPCLLGPELTHHFDEVLEVSQEMSIKSREFLRKILSSEEMWVDFPQARSLMALLTDR